MQRPSLIQIVDISADDGRLAHVVVHVTHRMVPNNNNITTAQKITVTCKYLCINSKALLFNSLKVEFPGQALPSKVTLLTSDCVENTKEGGSVSGTKKDEEPMNH